MLANRENERLLSDVLASRFDVVRALEPDPVDIVILDGISLSREWRRLQELRASAEPVYLPVLLATDRGDVGLLTRDIWRVVDDVIIRPIEKSELRARIEALMRARRLSLQLRRVANLYEHERDIARRLQEAALPDAFPVVPDVHFSAFYRPGSDEALIGGDWYDVIRLADGRVVLTVGDVAGAGLAAAITMANVRQVLRGVALVHPDPALMLEAADRALALDSGDRQVTAFVGVFDPVTGFFTYASAGHPPALLRDASGALQELSTHDLPLGIFRNVTRQALIVAIEEDSLLVLYTDGLTEATRDLLEGEDRLRRAVRHADAHDRPALAVYESVLVQQSKDDVAVVTMTCDAASERDASIRRWTFPSDDAAAAKAARRELTAELERAGMAARLLFDVEVVYAEMVGNVVRYASGEVEVVLDLSTAAPVLHVLDRGKGFTMTPRLPYDSLSERGRGLFIISELVEEFHVLRRTGGGSHASAVLRR